MRYRYAYQNSGHPILSWKDGPPRQTKAADCQALGSLGDDTLGILPLARPGAPEPVGDCRSYEPCVPGRPHTHPVGPLGDFVPSPGMLIAAGAAAYFLFFRKKKGR